MVYHSMLSQEREGKGRERKAMVNWNSVEYPHVLGYPMHSLWAPNPCGGALPCAAANG